MSSSMNDVIVCCSAMLRHANAKSSAFNGSPSLQRASSRRRKRYSLPSLETRMLSAIAGRQVAETRLRRLDALGGLEPGFLFDAAAERLVVQVLGVLEVERDVVGERHLEERVPGAALVAGARQELPGLAVILKGFLVGVDRPRRIARLEEVLHRFLRGVCDFEVPRQEPVGLLRRLLEDLLERVADPVMELLPLRLHEARVRDLLHEPVPEAVLRVGAPANLDDQVEALELGERVGELIVRNEALEQRLAKGTPDHGCDVHDLARLRVEPVEPRLQSTLHERRHRQLVDADRERPVAVPPLEHAAFDQVAEGLLEEERVAAGPLRQELGDRVGNLTVRGVADQLTRGVARERPQLDLLVAVRVTLARALSQAPRAVLALASVQEEEGDRSFFRHAEQALEQLERRLVGGVQVPEDEAERHLLGELAGPVVEELEGAVLDALAVELAQPLGGVGLERHAQDAREERVRLVGVLGAEQLRQLGLELEANAGLGRGRADAEPLAQEIADRPEGKVVP